MVYCLRLGYVTTYDATRRRMTYGEFSSTTYDQLLHNMREFSYYSHISQESSNVPAVSRGSIVVRWSSLQDISWNLLDLGLRLSMSYAVDAFRFYELCFQRRVNNNVGRYNRYFRVGKCPPSTRRHRVYLAFFINPDILL